MEQIIVVGSGFSGSILARKIAEELHLKVKVVEKRNHIGGNCYDELDQHGILIQKYGPHFLNTNNYSTLHYLKQYTSLFPHNTKLLSYLEEQYIRLPFNFQSVQQLLGEEEAETLLAKLRIAFQEGIRVPVLHLVEHEDKDIASFGNLLFEKAYVTYTSKMWGVPIDTIDKYVLERVPMAMSYDERYLNKDFQALPKHGFTELFENMLDHPNITVELNKDAMDFLTLDHENHKVFFEGHEVKCLIFTGAVDELCDYQFGGLPYRSLDIQYEYFNQSKVLPEEIISYPQAKGYTRRTEYRQIMFDDSAVDGTVIATEYPLTFDKDADIGNIPYYPVNTAESEALYQKYLEVLEPFSNIFLCGRLAEFKYYNMDVCIEHALKYFENIKNALHSNL